MRKSSARVLGPYENGQKWRLVILEGPQRKSIVADTHEAALKLREDLLRKLRTSFSRMIDAALEEYLADLESRGILADTIDKIGRMLRLFLPLTEELVAISAERAQQMYVEATRRKKANGEPLAADTHHLLLRRTKHFYKWALSRRYVERNPFAEIRPIGRPRRGKPQLRIDEARKFTHFALGRARTLDVGATAALMQVFLGLRPTEAVVRVVRDLDDEGRVLWVPFGKTQNAKRRLQVPDPLREILLQHAAGKEQDAPLLGPPGEGLHTRHTLRHCLQLLCEEAGVPKVCPHSLRGLNATLALEAGATAHHVAAALGHASFLTTARHYADASTVANAGLRKVAEVLTNSNRGPHPLDVPRLASLLREHLSAEQILLLRQNLSGS
jgi:integrase